MPKIHRMAMLALALSSPALAEQGSPAPAEAAVYIIAPVDGATVSSPVTVRFGLRGMGIAPAGIDLADTGHHHLLVDLDELPAAGVSIPADARHLHFGKGQTETQLELTPGEHSLQLLLGDYLHRPHHPPILSEKIRITVR